MTGVATTGAMGAVGAAGIMNWNLRARHASNGRDEKQAARSVRSHAGGSGTHESPGFMPCGTSTAMSCPFTFTVIAWPPTTPGGTCTDMVCIPLAMKLRWTASLESSSWLEKVIAEGENRSQILTEKESSWRQPWF